MAGHLRKKRDLIHASTTEILSKVNYELSKEAVDPDLLEELMEQLLLIHDCLDKIDREIEEQTKMEDLEVELKRVMDYKELITQRKTKIRRALRGAQRDAASVMSSEADNTHDCYYMK